MRVIESLEQMLGRVIMFLPNVVAALVILAIGWLIASGLARLTRKLVGRTRLNERLASHGFGKPGSDSGSKLAGGLVFWAIFVMVLGAAADALQVALISRTLERIVAYVPRFVVAGVMLAIGIAVAGWLKRMILQRSASSTTSASLMATAAQVGVIVLTSFMAARELDIGASILNTAFVLIVGAFAVAFAISFGLGSRDVAGRVARDWYERSGREPERRPFTGTERTVIASRPSAPSHPHS